MIVLGADTHKRSHTIAAVAASAGELLGEQTVEFPRFGGHGRVRRVAVALDPLIVIVSNSTGRACRAWSAGAGG